MIYLFICKNRLDCNDSNFLIEYKKKLVKTKLLDFEKEKVLKYPYLFHKQILNIVDFKKKINYNINMQIKLKKSYIAHIHCYNLDFFIEYYGNYFDKLIKFTDIIVTYSIGNCNKLYYYKITLLKINNKGMDIGGKFCAVNFINNQNKKYKYILFLHSKNNKKYRDLWFNSLIQNFKHIVKSNKNIGCIVPPNIRSGNNIEIIGLKKKSVNYNKIDKLCYREFVYNDLYLNEISEYLNINSTITLFPEGNCYILNSVVTEKLFGDKYLYNILNTPDTFDFNWVKNINFLQTNNLLTVFNYSKNNFKNNLKYINKEKHIGFSDGMIEHVFERLIFMVVKSLQYDIKIIKQKIVYKKLSDYINLLYDKNTIEY